jgi:hypothetical protein
MMALLPIMLFVRTDIYEKVETRRLKRIRTFRKQTKNVFLPLRVYADNKYFPQKLFVFSQFHLTKRMTFMSKFTKLHSYVLRFLNEKTNIHVSVANVLWVAFLILSGSLSLVKYPV